LKSEGEKSDQRKYSNEEEMSFCIEKFLLHIENQSPILYLRSLCLSKEMINSILDKVSSLLFPTSSIACAMLFMFIYDNIDMHHETINIAKKMKEIDTIRHHYWEFIANK